tara:strand:- start:33712 stop:34707 length:996 start_codon:yes stop_codon:yes gene_type:complete
MILEDYETIYLLIRPKSVPKAIESFANYSNVKLVEGDILSNDVFLNVEDLSEVVENIDSILHLAGGYDLQMNVLDAYTHNVVGVQNTLELARKCKRLKYFHHVSTYAVNAHKKGKVFEADRLENYSHHDHYTRSKLQGEILVHKTHIGDVKKRIYRPGIVVGDTLEGSIEKVDGPYYFLNFLFKLEKHKQIIEKLGIFPIPCSKKASLPLIPVDSLCTWLAHAIVSPTQDQVTKTYHFVGKEQINLRQFVEMCLREMEIECSVVPVRSNFLLRKTLQKIGIPEQLIFYMFSEAHYSTRQRRTDFGELKEFSIPESVPTLIKGARDYLKDKK